MGVLVNKMNGFSEGLAEDFKSRPWAQKLSGFSLNINYYRKFLMALYCFYQTVRPNILAIPDFPFSSISFSNLMLKDLKKLDVKEKELKAAPRPSFLPVINDSIKASGVIFTLASVFEFLFDYKEHIKQHLGLDPQELICIETFFLEHGDKWIQFKKYFF